MEADVKGKTLLIHGAMKYTKEEVEDLVSKFEKAAERQRENIGKAVRLRAAERDLLKATDVVRDQTEKSIKGDKKLLVEVFGGESALIPRMRAVLEQTELSEFNSKCQNLVKLEEHISTLEELLEKIGSGGFRVWQGPKKAPETVAYRGWGGAKRFLPGEAVDFAPKVTGTVAAGLQWAVEPALPAGLTLDTVTGKLSGELVLGEEVPEKTYKITCSNVAGATSVEIKFSVLEPVPTALSYKGVAAECVTDLSEGAATPTTLLLPQATPQRAPRRRRTVDGFSRKPTAANVDAAKVSAIVPVIETMLDKVDNNFNGRTQVPMEGATKSLEPVVTGILLKNELDHSKEDVDDPKKPKAEIVGSAKTSTTIPTESIIEKEDKVDSGDLREEQPHQQPEEQPDQQPEQQPHQLPRQ